MAPASVVVLHGGAALEITLLEYLFRVVVYLFAFGGVAVVGFCGLEVVSAIRSRVVEGDGANDP